MPSQTTLKQRQSGIELLKIIAMFLIVTAHCVQTVQQSDNWGLNEFNIVHKSADISIFFTEILRYMGVLGNAVFLICSVWFLTDSSRIKLNKIAHMLLNIYVISVTFMLIFLGGG